jgi:hypothetical protein
MADTVTIRSDADTEHALDILTRDGTNRSEAIRQAVLEAAVRRERLVEMKRAFLRHPMPAPNGANLADDIASDGRSTGLRPATIPEGRYFPPGTWFLTSS